MKKFRRIGLAVLTACVLTMLMVQAALANPGNNKTDISAAVVTGGTETQIYDGTPKVPKIVVKLNNVDITNDVKIDYVTDNKEIGLVKFNVEGKGKYTGKVANTFEFKIIPAATVQNKPARLKKGFKAKWQEVKGGCFYEIQYKLKGTSKWKTKTSKSLTTFSKSVKKLKAKKYYKIRIRAYKVVAGVKYAGAWSKTKTVRTK